MISNTHYAIADIETTGLSPDKNAMIEFAMIILNNKLEEVDRYSMINKVYDDRAIQPQALAVHGITMKEIEAGITLQESVTNIDKILSKYCKGRDKIMLVGHNMSFDMGFIINAWKFCNKDIFKYTYEQYMCTMRMSHMAWADDSIPNFKLGTCCERIGVSIADSHRGLADVISTVELFKHHVNNMRNTSSSEKVVNSGKSEGYERAHEFKF